MAIMKWRPTREMALPSDIFSMQRDINRLFDNFFRGGPAWEEGELAPSAWLPAVDVAEQENEFLVKVELPGVNKDDVKITLQNNVLTVKGEKKQEKEAKGVDYHRVERSYGSFCRSFTLPSTVKADRIDASYKDGILSVTLPKAEEAKPKQIEVKVK